MSDLKPLLPLDQYNQTLADNVHPKEWINPQPAERYNLVVIGAGTAGLVVAAGAAGLGAKVALIERELMGGDCLNVGCVPSKGIISAARALAAVKQAGDLGVRIPAGTEVDFAAVMERMRRLRAGISHHDSAARFRSLGVDVFLGQASFHGDERVDVGEHSLRFQRAVIATGARAAIPPFPGLDHEDVLTNETLFSLTELPRRLVVIGGGPIGAEMAQTFSLLGSEVTLIEKHDHILNREDHDAANIVQNGLQRDGVNLMLRSEVLRASRDGSERLVTVQTGGKELEIRADQILVSIGRQPNVDGLNLEQVGVNYDARHGVQVNDRLQTTNARIFAAGDIASEYKFTHAADFMARIVIQNALFMGRRKVSTLTIPWATYTSPELAHVGLNEKTAEQRGIQIDTFTQKFDGVDRAILDSQTDGFVKVHVRRGSDQIVGATIVADHAGDLISSISIAMTNRIGLKKIANSIFPYPTQAEAIRKVGDLYNRSRLTPFVKQAFSKWLAWNR